MEQPAPVGLVSQNRTEAPEPARDAEACSRSA